MRSEEPYRRAISAAVSEIEGRPRRITVNLSTDAIHAIDNVIREEGVSLTESVRRLLHYGDFVYRTTSEGGELLIRHMDGGTETVVLL